MIRALWATIIMFTVLATQQALWAEFAPYNRPNPLMDYVPQEIGIYDTAYWELEESDCRKCHGDSLAERHHLTETVVAHNQCAPCHDEIQEPLSVITDCTTSGCHSWDDVEENGWHHQIDLLASDSCTECHDPNLIQEVNPVGDFETYPPSYVTPSQFSCENCHWRQDYVLGGSPDYPGHPSTYDHYNLWGDFVGFHEYARPIYSNFDNHHMGFKAKVTFQCYTCHGLETGLPDWDPDNPELIRACEACHSPDSLHMISPHTYQTNGWEAVGFHVPHENTQTRDLDPCVYRTWDYTGPYLPERSDGFTVNQMCFGCHGDDIPDSPRIDDCEGNAPVIDTAVEGIQPKYGTCGAIVTVRGENFGLEQCSGREVQIRQKSSGNWIGNWTDIPIFSWADTLIEVEIPCWTFNPGNYRVQVMTECGKSNRVNFALKDWVSVTSITPDHGPCGLWLTIEGDSFGNRQSRIFSDGYHGIHYVVDVVSGQGMFTARNYRNWSHTSLEVRFKNFFEDGVDPSTGERNFVQDDGGGACSNEPTMNVCEGLDLGPWSVYVKAVYFGDDDGDGGLSCGDTVFQVVSSETLYFDLTNEMAIFRLNPDRIELGRRLKIFGANFGLSSGEVRIGTLAQAKDPTLGLGKLQQQIISWSNTLIKVKVKGRSKWEGKSKYVWVENNNQKGNYEALDILAP